MIYYVKLTNGYCGLSDQPKGQILLEEGTNNVQSITKATKEQIDWILSMDGYVPETVKGEKK